MNPEPESKVPDQTQPEISNSDIVQGDNQTLAEDNVSQQAPVSSTPAQEVSQAVAPDNYRQLKSLLIKVLLGCLIAAASVAVVAILIGSMSEVVWRSIGTIFSAIIHIGIVFAIISITTSGNSKVARTTDFVVNASLVIAICSFFTSVFSTWDVLDGEIAAKLYATYIVLLLSVLHGKTLLDVEAVYQKVKPYVLANLVFIGLVAAMVLGVVYVDEGWRLLDGFYGRLLAASAVISVTLSVVVAVMHRLFIQKHPELQTVKAKHSAGRIIVAILLLVFVVFPLISTILGFMMYR